MDVKGEEIVLHLGDDAFDVVDNQPITYTYCAECAQQVLIPRGHKVAPKANIVGLSEGQQVRTLCVICKQMKCIDWNGQTISVPRPKPDENGNLQYNENNNLIYYGHGDCETCERALVGVPEFPDLDLVCGYWYEQNKDNLVLEIQKHVRKIMETHEPTEAELEWQRLLAEQKEMEAEQYLSTIDPNDFAKESFLPEQPKEPLKIIKRDE